MGKCNSNQLNVWDYFKSRLCLCSCELDHALANTTMHVLYHFVTNNIYSTTECCIGVFSTAAGEAKLVIFYDNFSILSGYIASL